MSDLYLFINGIFLIISDLGWSVLRYSSYTLCIPLYASVTISQTQTSSHLILIIHLPIPPLLSSANISTLYTSIHTTKPIASLPLVPLSPASSSTTKPRYLSPHINDLHPLSTFNPLLAGQLQEGHFTIGRRLSP